MAQLATDLGIGVPEEGTEEYKEWKEKSNNLPGQARNLLTELEKPLRELFSSSIGLETASIEIIGELEEKLKAFEERAENEIEERLEWARKERSEKKAGLMIKAAAYFPAGSNNCPVCTQELDRVPEVKKELEELRVYSLKEHLQKEIKDYERSLIGQLDGIVSPQQRTQGEKSFAGRLNEDWGELKKSQCKDLLLSVAERFDDGMTRVAGEVQEVTVEQFNIPAEYEKEFAGEFSDYGEVLYKAKQYVELCKSASSNKDNVSEKLKYLLKQSKVESESEAFKEILERARATNEELVALMGIRKSAGELWKSAKKAEELRERIKNLTELANSADYIKELKMSVRKEVIGLVEGELGERTKSYYKKLYDNEVLEYAKLAPGNAGNPDIKNEINLYLRAGKHLVPMGPYSNSGRMRALILSFCFALLERSHGSLGLLILDDPALSLDDEHKVRFVDELVEPVLTNTQVVLGTHYERFYEDSEPVFDGSVKLKMIRRQRAADDVEFEPGDLLERVEKTLNTGSGYWKEVAGNLRKWIERTLSTLSGYGSEPFIVYNNLPQSIDNYAGITDQAFATPERETIVQALRSRHVERVISKLHHNESVNRPDVEDALRILQGCSKTVEKEIIRVKGLYQHALLGRGRGTKAGVDLRISRFERNVIDENLEVVREAAAAHNAQGIEWEVSDEYRLEGYPIVLLCSEVISPIALPGQYLVIDWEEREPESRDLVIVETDDGKRYVRRIWKKEDKTIVLEGANPTTPYEPVHVIGGECRVRRIVGVLYDNVDVALGGEGEKWVPGNLSDGWFDRVVGVRVGGTSLEPVVRNGQIVLVEKQDMRQAISNDMLACVSVRNEGDFIKRCYVNESQCFLFAINPTNREVPMVMDIEEIDEFYPLKGVLFEVGFGSSVE